MLKIGVLGMSEGNGHPYSWSAIFNGYEQKSMESCGFPVIPRYLEREPWPDSCIPDAQVVSIWTQDLERSKHIAKATKIKDVVRKPEEMLGKIDALLLARDDAENHLNFLTPFLTANIPVYVDKPCALSLNDLEEIYRLEKYKGQIFTCSALRYSEELELTDNDRQSIGTITRIVAFTPNSWDKYAVHIIEPVLKMLPAEDQPVRFLSERSIVDHKSDGASLTVIWQSGIVTTFYALGDGVSPINIRVIGTKNYRELVFRDTFSAFKKALNGFVSGIRENKVNSPLEFNKKVVQIIQKGRL